MKVLLVHEYYRSNAPSGEDRVFENEKALLEHGGIEVESLTFHNDSIGTQGGPSVLKTAVYTPWSLMGIGLMKEAIERYRPDIAHFHNTFPILSPSAIYQAKGMGVATVQTFHNFRSFCANAMLLYNNAVCERCVGSYPWPAIINRCYRGSLFATIPLALTIVLHRFIRTWQKKVDRFIVLSEFSKTKFVQAGMPEEKIRVKPNFFKDVPPGGNAKDGSWIFIGRIKEEKGVHYLAQVWKRLGRSAPVLNVVGDGPYSDKLRCEIAENSLQDKIILQGNRSPDEVRSLLSKASLLVFPSISYEGFPLVIGEAYQQGVPVAASKIGTPASLVLDGKTGVHFKAGDVMDMADKLGILLNDPNLLTHLGHNARAEYLEHYTPESNLKKLLEIYNEAIRV